MTLHKGKPYEGNDGDLPGYAGRRKISGMSDTSTLLRERLQQLEAAMRAASLWGAQPPSEEALASTMPFMYDTLQIEQWLQWVFMPRLHAMLDAGAAWPASCSVQPLAEHEWSNRFPSGSHVAALALLAQIDAAITEAGAGAGNA